MALGQQGHRLREALLELVELLLLVGREAVQVVQVFEALLAELVALLLRQAVRVALLAQALALAVRRLGAARLVQLDLLLLLGELALPST